MSAIDIPTEILHTIFTHLNGSDIETCGRVCLRWEYAVDCLTDKFWKKICANDYPDLHQTAYRKATLTWRELNASLNLWPAVATANVRIYDTPATCAYIFQTLENGVISYPQTKSYYCDVYNKVYNIIVYYDLNALRECHHEYLDFKFESYQENENIIVLSDEYKFGERNIRIIPKANKKCFMDFHRKKRWILLEDEVYIVGPDMKISYVKLIEQDNAVTLTRDAIHSSGPPKKWQLKDFHTLDSSFYDTYDVAVLVQYDKVLIIGTYAPQGMVYIFCNINEHVNALTAKPDKSIDLHELTESGRGNEYTKFKMINQIDVVETVNGHKVIVLYGGRIFVIELSYDKHAKGEKQAKERKLRMPTIKKCVVA